jgi:hypothetical protein
VVLQNQRVADRRGEMAPLRAWLADGQDIGRLLDEAALPQPLRLLANRQGKATGLQR